MDADSVLAVREANVNVVPDGALHPLMRVVEVYAVA
jgi:hypothetical protein